MAIKYHNRGEGMEIRYQISELRQDLTRCAIAEFDTPFVFTSQILV